MPTPRERLERTFSETTSAEGAEFFRRLRDYCDLLTTDRVIRRATETIEQEAAEANAAFAQLDATLVDELSACRHELVSIEPTADDSDDERPRILSLELGKELTVWKKTLANFDSIAAGSVDDIEPAGLDDSRSRMLESILYDKLRDLRNPPGWKGPESARPDLDDLTMKVSEIRAHQEEAHRQLENQLDSIGFLALLSLRVLMTYLQEPLDTEVNRDTIRRWIVEILKESGDPYRLREAVRPEQVRGSLSQAAQKTVAAHEPSMRESLGRVQHALRFKLEPTGMFAAWKRLGKNEKIGILSLTVAFLGIVVAVVIAITF